MAAQAWRAAYDELTAAADVASLEPPGAVPFRLDGLAARLLLARVTFGVFHHVLTLDTPIGRRARGNGEARTVPLIRVKPRDLAAGVEHLPRTVGVRDGLPLLEDGRTANVGNVVWCTGYAPSLDWIDLPVFGEHDPLHRRGVVPSQPGLYFVGLHFQYALSSSQVQGVSRDAAHVAQAIATAAARAGAPQRLVTAQANA